MNKPCLAGVAILTGGMLFAAGVLAQSAADFNQCASETTTNDGRIITCTRLIESGKLSPHNLAVAYNNRGIAWYTKSDLDRAIADYNEALRLNPQYANAFLNRGNAWGDKGNLDRAIADYNEALRLNPQDADAFYNRGSTWRDKGNFARAIADYSEAIRLNPQFADAFSNRGRVLFYQARFDMAVADLAAANRLANNAYTAIWLYLARMRAGTSAQDDLAQQAQALPVDMWPVPVINLYLGNLKPEALAPAAANLDPKTQTNQQCEADFYLGEWYLLHNNVARAKKLLREAEADCPKGFNEYQGAVAELKRLGL